MDTIFTYTARAAVYPEYLSVTWYDGQLEIAVRGPHQGEKRGSTAAMVLPPEAVAELSHKLLALPSVKALNGAKAVIMQFGNDADRAEFIALSRDAADGMPQIEAP